MYVRRADRLVYLAHPRTASRATVEALRDQIGIRRWGGHHGRIQDEWDQTDITEDWRSDRWTIVTAVRNHFDALVSWRFRHPAASTFSVEWLRNFVTNNRRGRDYVRDHRMYWSHLDAATHVLRYETLEEDLDDVLNELGLGPVTLDHVGDGNRPPGSYREHYSDTARAFAEGYFKHELKRLGYEF